MSPSKRSVHSKFCGAESSSDQLLSTASVRKFRSRTQTWASKHACMTKTPGKARERDSIHEREDNRRTQYIQDQTRSSRFFARQPVPHRRKQPRSSELGKQRRQTRHESQTMFRGVARATESDGFGDRRPWALCAYSRGGGHDRLTSNTHKTENLLGYCFTLVHIGRKTQRHPTQPTDMNL